AEIAIRIARAAAQLGLKTVAIYSPDDVNCLHVKRCDEARELKKMGVNAYLDIEGILNVTKEAGADLIHPGYGFLSENPQFARRCEQEGITFVGPSSDQLQSFGDKLSAKSLAKACNVPLIPGTSGPTSLQQTLSFFKSLPPNSSVMIKSTSGGGGRGIRVAHTLDALPEAYARAQSESLAAFGSNTVYVEQLVTKAKHVEVQIVGDGTGEVVHLWERECSLQRRHQKVIEVAPCVGLDEGLRKGILDAAVRMARKGAYKSLGTFEFLVSPSTSSFYFMECNPRLQVEHTVTEQITSLDLVQTQLRIALGETLSSISLTHPPPPPTTFALQLRVNSESPSPTDAIPSIGTLKAFDPPLGPHTRVDTHAYTGYTISPSFDSLLAKLIVSGHTSLPATVDAARRAVKEFRIQGVETNLKFLEALCGMEEVVCGKVWTGFVEEKAAEIAERVREVAGGRLYFEDEVVAGGGEVKVNVDVPEGSVAVSTPIQGTVVSIDVKEGDIVEPNQQIAVISAMKMEHVVTTPHGGQVTSILHQPNAIVSADSPLIFLTPTTSTTSTLSSAETVHPSFIRPDLADLLARHHLTSDAARPDAVARRRKTGQRTAWENVEDLCDEGSFVEVGSLAIAAQRSRRSEKDLIVNTPRDGIITGLGSINGDLYSDPEKTRAVVIAYDYTVLAGTQGYFNHLKQDRVLGMAKDRQIPVVIFCEGGGGRPGDTDNNLHIAGLDVTTFRDLGELSGLVPLVGIASGRCFAGNAALLGACDVIIATEGANIGMGGPAMIEGGGLGVFRPEEVGPTSVQVPNGVIDILVKNETEAVAVAKEYLSYFQGPISTWSAPDQRLLRRMIPENRLRAYDIRTVIHGLADEGSVLELRPKFGVGIVTAFVRIEGHPFGLIANNPHHLGGAIDAPASDKCARFIQLCDAFDIPILSLCDTPGFMVGPEAEKSGQVRHFARMLVGGASVTVPLVM
ncbi:hypothetical protein HK104_004552, partial [Borealophlyctis nickersoniae]